MTLSTTINRLVFSGNGVTDTFPFPHRFYVESHIVVTVDGVVQVLGGGADYTLTGVGLPGGGDVEFEPGSIPAVGVDNVVVERIVPLDQDADPQNFDGNPADSVEIVYDLMVMRTQQIEDKVNRAPKLPITSTGVNVTLPNPVDGEFPVWSGVIGLMINSGVSIGSITVSVADAAASAAAALVSETNAGTSAGNALTSETNAAASAVAAAASAAGAAAVAINWLFDDAIVVEDPGTGDFRFNNATISAATLIIVSAQAGSAGNPDVSDFVDTWDDSNNPTGRGFIVIRKQGAPSFFAIFNVTGNITDNGTDLEIPVTFVDGNGALTDTDSIFFQFTRTGDRGATGAGTGDLLAANNLSDVASAATSRTNLGLQIGVNVAAFNAAAVFTDVAQEFTRQQNFNATTLSDGANIAWDLSQNQVVSVTLGGNRTLDNPTNQKDGATYIITIKQDATGSRTLSFGGAYQFPGGTAPTLTAAANSEDVLTFVSDGTNMKGIFQGDFS